MTLPHPRASPDQGRTYELSQYTRILYPFMAAITYLNYQIKQKQDILTENLLFRLYLNGEEGVYDPVDHIHGGHGGHGGHHQHSSKSRKSGGAPRPPTSLPSGKLKYSKKK